MEIIKGKLYFIKIKRWKYPAVKKELPNGSTETLNLDVGKHVGLALASVAPTPEERKGNLGTWYSIPFLINTDLVRVLVSNTLRLEQVFDGPLE